MEYLPHSQSETQRIAADLAQKVLAQSNNSKALVIALEGELGAGKTTFVQAFGNYCGITTSMTSPTFVIMKSYTIERPPTHFKHLIHIDCYRLIGAENVQAIGFKELIDDPDNILMIEWSERIAEALPRDRITVHIDHIDNTQRKITIAENGTTT